MGYRFGNTTKKNLSGINPILEDLAYKAIEKSCVDFGVINLGGLRTAEQQRKMFDRGVSKADGTNNLSRHQSGNAVDLIPYIKGKYTWADAEAFQKIHTIIAEVWEQMDIKKWELVWGGHWTSFVDVPHYELRRK